jgi:hypothetical protein
MDRAAVVAGAVGELACGMSPLAAGKVIGAETCVMNRLMSISCAGVVVRRSR